jgi:hypothetical protein
MKDTRTDLVRELESILPHCGATKAKLVRQVIERARRGDFHDYKSADRTRRPEWLPHHHVHVRARGRGAAVICPDCGAQQDDDDLSSCPCALDAFARPGAPRSPLSMRESSRRRWDPARFSPIELACRPLSERAREILLLVADGRPPERSIGYKYLHDAGFVSPDGRQLTALGCEAAQLLRSRRRVRKEGFLGAGRG